MFKTIDDVKKEAYLRMASDAEFLEHLFSIPKIQVTGSQRFGYATPDSDLDLFIPRSSYIKCMPDGRLAILHLITDLQFRVEASGAYRSKDEDDDRSLYKILHCDRIIGPFNSFHIQIVKDECYEDKVLANAILDVLVAGPDASYWISQLKAKSVAKKIWGRLMAINISKELFMPRWISNSNR
jgi:predicted nucleotidyltransferase